MNTDSPSHKWPNLTPSRAGDLVCRKKFFELYVLKSGPGEAFSPALVYGQAAHDILKRVYNPATGIPPQDANVEAIANRVFAAYTYPDPADRNTDRLRCITMIQAYVAHNVGAAKIISVEDFKSTPLTNTMGRLMLTLGAKFDCLLVRPPETDTLIIRDYKTGKPGAADMTAACIMLAIGRKQYPQYVKAVVEFDWIGTGGLMQRTTITLAEAKEVWKDLKAAAMRVYFATEFPPEPGEHCMFCPLKSACQPDQQATVEEIDAIFD